MKRIIQRTSKDHPLYDPSLGGYVVAVCTPTNDITRLSRVLDAQGFTLEIGPENVEEPFDEHTRMWADEIMNPPENVGTPTEQDNDDRPR